MKITADYKPPLATLGELINALEELREAHPNPGVAAEDLVEGAPSCEGRPVKIYTNMRAQVTRIVLSS